MKITDEMVETGAKAGRDALMHDRLNGTLLAPRQSEIVTRAALTAALGDVEPEPLREISAICNECGGQWFWPLENGYELRLSSCHEHSDPPETLEDVLGDRFVLDSVSKNATDAPGEWAVRVVDLEWPMLPRKVIATGSTVLSATRRAVANTKGNKR